MIRRIHVSGHHKELLRTNLWLVPALLVLAAIGLFVITLLIDLAAFHGDFSLPSWVINGSADAARQILTTIAAAIITVVGVVFSIVIVALTLVSTQFGPRMLRTFIRDRGTQLTLGTFVATFVYAVLALVSIGGRGRTGRSCRISASPSTLALTVVNLAVLIYFIHHIATQIQLPEVIAGISADLSAAIEGYVGDGAARPGDPTAAAVLASLPEEGGVVLASDSGYLQYVHRRTLLRIAEQADARDLPALPARAFPGPGQPAGHGVAGQRGARGGPRAYPRPPHRPVPDAGPGRVVRHRPASGDRDPRPLVRCQ